MLKFLKRLSWPRSDVDRLNPVYQEAAVASTYSIIGQPVPARVDGTGKVTGVTRYADDLFLPRMLYGKLLRSPHPHAHILSIDISQTAALPGVFAVITGADLPQPYSIMPVNQAAQAAFQPAKPLDNTDLTLSYRKKMVRVYVARVLCQLADLPDTP